MKKFIVLAAFVLASLCGVAQHVAYQPYVSGGTTLSSGTLSYGAEVGMYANKVWYSLGASFYEDNASTNQWYGSIKAYYKIGHQGFVDDYVWGAANVHISKDRAISFEPGVCAVFNISDHWAPQVSLSFPIYENTKSVWKPLQMNLGVGINYWLP